MGTVSVPDSNDRTIELFYRDVGSGRPIVLIHGYPLDGGSWERQETALLEAGYRVIAYDRRGFGRSSHPASGYDYDTFADDLAAVIDHLGLMNVTLVGFSMGSGEVARYLHRHGESKVHSAVFIGCLEPFLLKTADNPLGAVDRAFIEDFSASVRADRYAHFTDFFNDFFNTDENLGTQLSQQALDHHWHVAAQSGAQAAALAPFTWIEDFRPDLPYVSVPTAIIHGTGDRILPIDATARRLKESLPTAYYTEIEGAPHGLLWTHGDEVNDALLKFLETQENTVK